MRDGRECFEGTEKKLVIVVRCFREGPFDPPASMPGRDLDLFAGEVLFAAGTVRRNAATSGVAALRRTARQSANSAGFITRPKLCSCVERDSTLPTSKALFEPGRNVSGISWPIDLKPSARRFTTSAEILIATVCRAPSSAFEPWARRT